MQIMKKITIYLILIFTCTAGISQNVFNRIIEDTAAHIVNSVIVLDTGYVYLSGTRNTHNIRSFALTYVNELGEKQWKKIYGDTQNQMWEGWNGNLRQLYEGCYVTGPYVNTNENKRGIHISVFDSLFNLKSQNVICYDTIDKRAFYSIKTTFDDYFITGQICDTGDNDTYKLLLLKANNSGEYIWHKNYNINASEYGSTIIETSNNNLLIGGRTEVTDIGNTRWYLLKTDTAGNVIWERAFGRSNYSNGHVQGLIETSDSNYLACGAYPVARYGGGGGEYLWDGCLRKIDTNGNLILERLYRNYSKYSTGGDESIRMKESFAGIYQDDNNIFVIGNTYDSNPFFRGSMIKLNSRGDIIFKRLYYAIDQYSNEQWLVSFQPTNDGGFILAGYGNAYDWYGYDPSQQAWLVKTDSLGIDGLCYTAPPELNIDIVLPETVNCSDTIIVYAYIAGKSAPYTIETSVGQLIDSIYYPPTFVPVEIGLTHVNLEWDNSTYFEETITEATLSNHEWGQCIAKPIEFYTPHTSGTQQINITVTDAYGESKTITKDIYVNDNCGSWIADEVINPINLYPNPTKNILYVDITHTDLPVSCEIYNSVGQIVKTLQLSNSLSVINLKDFASGMYRLKITDSNGNTLVSSFEKQ